jgi:hypothetical protein
VAQIPSPPAQVIAASHLTPERHGRSFTFPCLTSLERQNAAVVHSSTD